MIFRTINHKDKKVTIGTTTQKEWETVLELVNTVDNSCAIGKTSMEENK
jgi:hypothetical protein